MRIPGYLLPQTCSYQPYTGNTAHGPTYGTATALRCRIEPRRDVYRAQDGSEVVVSAMLFTFPEAPLVAQGRVTFGSVDYEIVAVEELPGPTGSIHHKEALLK